MTDEPKAQGSAANDPLGSIFSKVRAGLDAPVDGPVDAVSSSRAESAPSPREVPPPAVPGVGTGAVDFVPEVVAVDLLELGPVDPEPQWPAFSVAESATLDDEALRRRRDASVSSAVTVLAPKVKRHLQDEQNELLDAVRRLRTRADVDAVMPGPDEQLTAWSELLGAAVDDVYAAGRVLGGGRTRPAPGDLVGRLAEVLVTPLRDRVVVALATALSEGEEAGEADRARAIANAVGARYREWRGQDLEPTLGDLLTWAFARGVFDATPNGTTLRWVPAERQQCPDADDNALEPTCKGSAFPTGQSCPPAHPGCRCLVVPSDD
ncbi:MAG: hypothetical protein WCI50_03255 [Actinomycetes bacterium]